MTTERTNSKINNVTLLDPTRARSLRRGLLADFPSEKGHRRSLSRRFAKKKSRTTVAEIEIFFPFYSISLLYP